MTITPTQSQLERVTKDYSDICQEKVEVEFLGGTMYVFGSELACLRLHYKMNSGRVEFSSNLNSWVYSKE